jgi:DNA repair protein RadA/Sms
MAKSSTKFICQQCGFESVKWMGRCPDCGEWNSFAETIVESGRGPAGRNSSRTSGAIPVPLTEVQAIAHKRSNTGSPEMDRVLGGGLVPGSLVLLGGEPGIGKCVTGDTRILDPASGDLLPITEYAQGTHQILALDEAIYRLGESRPSLFHEQGVRPIVEVTTRLGRTLRCTPSHPVLTPTGWYAVGDLAPGSRIAAPRALPYFGQEAMTDVQVKLLAYILSDGSATSQISVTNQLPEVEADLRQIADAFGMELRVYETPRNRAKQYRFVIPLGARAESRQAIAAALQQIHDERKLTWAGWAHAAGVSAAMMYFWKRGEAAPSEAELQQLAEAAGVPLAALLPETHARSGMVTPMARFLVKHGLRFKSASTKAIPTCVFRLPKAQLATFLKALFTCDGSVFVSRKGQAGISYVTISKRLAADVQHLLLRFGFVARLRTKPMRVNGEDYTAYELQLLGLPHVKRFQDEIGILGRDEAKAKIQSLSAPVLPSTHFDTIPTGTAFWDDMRIVSGDASFKALSRAAGTIIHPGRMDGPLAHATVVALAAAYASANLQRLAHGNVYWDTIESITPAGEAQVYDITVPDRANFVANDLIIHNSTLLLQTAGDLALRAGGVLYVCAEESPQQIRLRAERLGIQTPELLLLAETDIEAIVQAAEQAKPSLVIVDSIQTVASQQITSAPGSISQVRECTLRLMHLAKRTNVPVCIIGHVTKEGTVAGPRTLEHMVDAVLYLEGERFHAYRLLRGVKNRFGATNEVGVFEMRGEGMVDVANPSALFLTERHGQASGSAVVISMEGTRPLLVEVQALASTSAFGTPRCTTTGVDHNRVLLLLAVLNKRVGLALGNQDVYVNIAGGFTLNEPAVDLGIAAAVASSFRERPISSETALLGEVGLGGELRQVPRADLRVREAAKLGFRRCVVPAHGMGLDRKLDASTSGGIELLRAATLTEALEMALD